MLDKGSLDGEDVLWVQDEETGEEGFMTLYAEDDFWVLKSNRSGGFTYRRACVTTQKILGGQTPIRNTVTPTWQLDYQCLFLRD